jgi:hypothetical protein
MDYFRLRFGLFLLLPVAGGRADDGPAQAPPSLKEDLVKLHGSWKLTAPPKGSHLYLEFEKTGILDITHALMGQEGQVEARSAFVAFELKGGGQKRSLTPKQKGERPLTITYRFDKGALVIEEGECAIRDVQSQRDYRVSRKGEWKRISADLEKLQASWGRAKPTRGTEIRLEFDKDLLEVVSRFPNELGMGPVHQELILVELKEDGKRCVITPVNKRAGISRTIYRFDGDTLVVEDGEYTIDGRKISLKGEWKGIRVARSQRAP